ncbi:MAG: Bug family tripartite tricarboxylate transporter substrate binding protein [Beijerinckiaceae bacterium]
MKSHARISPVLAMALVSALVSALATSSTSAQAQTWPERSIKFVVPNAAGGGFDIMARILAERLQKRLGQSIVVENRAGAGTRTGSTYAARATPDGYTWLFGALSNIALNAGLYKNLAYDPLRDFKPAGLTMIGGYTLVTHKDAKFNSLKEFVAYAKANPDKATYASAGNGSGQHIAMAVTSGLAGIKLVHVPYRGAQPAYQDLLAGRVDVFFDSNSGARGLLNGGRTKALAVSSAKRVPTLPNVPTLQETGVANFAMESWSGVFLPAATPAAVFERLGKEIRAVMAEPGMAEQARKIGQEPMIMTGPEAAKFAETEILRWKKLLADNGLAQ